MTFFRFIFFSPIIFSFLVFLSHRKILFFFLLLLLLLLIFFNARKRKWWKDKKKVLICCDSFFFLMTGVVSLWLLNPEILCLFFLKAQFFHEKPDVPNFNKMEFTNDLIFYGVVMFMISEFLWEFYLSLRQVCLKRLIYIYIEKKRG